MRTGLVFAVMAVLAVFAVAQGPPGPTIVMETDGREYIISTTQGQYEADTVFYNTPNIPAGPIQLQIVFTSLDGAFQALLQPPYDSYKPSPFLSLVFNSTGVPGVIRFNVVGYVRQNGAPAKLSVKAKAIPQIGFNQPQSGTLQKGDSWAGFTFNLDNSNVPADPPAYLIVANQPAITQGCTQTASAIRAAANTIPRDFFAEEDPNNFYGIGDNNLERAKSSFLYIPLTQTNLAYGTWYLSVGYANGALTNVPYESTYKVTVSLGSAPAMQAGDTIQGSLQYGQVAVRTLVIPKQDASKYPIWVELTLTHVGAQIFYKASDDSGDIELPRYDDEDPSNTQMSLTCQGTKRARTNAPYRTQYTSETMIINDPGSSHRQAIVVQSRNYNITDWNQCTTNQPFTLTSSQVKTTADLPVLAMRQCSTVALRAHSASYFKFVVPANPPSQIGIKAAIARPPGTSIHQGFAVGVVISTSGIPQGYEYQDADAWQRSSVSIDVPVAGTTYYVAVIGGVNVGGSAYYTREQECQGAVEHLERAGPISVVLSVSGNTPATQVCSGQGSCDIVNNLGTCNCDAGYASGTASRCTRPSSEGAADGSKSAAIGLGVAFAITLVIAVYLGVRLMRAQAQSDTSDMGHVPLRDA